MVGREEGVGMRILLALDKFRGSLDATQAGGELARGIARAWPHAECRVLPMADGGEGTVEAVLSSVGGRWIPVEVHDPLGRPRTSGYAWLEQETALVEMAQASGLALLDPAERSPLQASSRGTGELLAAAVAAGAKRVVLAVGGSATVDGGAGLLVGLGCRLWDKTGRELDGSGGSLGEVSRLDLQPAVERLCQVEVEIASDVTHPLLGAQGAARVFAPQKGATPEQVAQLEVNLAHWAQMLRNAGGPADLGTRPGTGAAGGIAAALLSVAPHVQVVPGVEWVAQAVRLDEAIQWADLVITGEGRLDEQTAGGKVVAGVGRHARRLGRPVVAIVGTIGGGWQADPVRLRDACGLLAEASILLEPMELSVAMARAPELLAAAGERMARWLEVGISLGKSGNWQPADESTCSARQGFGQAAGE